MARRLGLKDLIGIGIGAVIGSGIFVTVGVAAAGSPDYVGAGPAVALSLIVVALVSFFSALCYAELASMIPISGSAYTYTYATMGELMAWIIGWDLILEYTIGNVAVAIGWGSYFDAFLRGLGIHLPDWLLTSAAMATPEMIAAAPHIGGIPIMCNVPAVLIMVLLTILLVKGVRESATFNDILVVLKIVLILVVIGLAAGYVNPENWKPFIPNGWAGIQAGAALVFFSYVGFDAVSTVAEETQDPERTVPLGMFWTLVICTVLYVAMALVVTGVVPYTQLGVADPMALIFEVLNMPWATVIVSLGALIAMTGVLLVFQLGQPRIFMVMARDGLLPEFCKSIHPKFKTPHVTTILCGVVVAIAAGFTDLSTVLELCNIGTLFALIMVSVGVLILRRTQPDRPRPFRTPMGVLFPLLSIASCLMLIYAMPYMTWVRFAIWIAVGVVLYYCYGIRHSNMAHDAEAVEAETVPSNDKTEP